MIIHNIDPTFIDIGFIEIRWYSIAYIVGIIFGFIYAKRIIKSLLIKYNFLKVSEKSIDESIIYLVLGIIIGGRLGYVFFYDFVYYLKNFPEIYMVWKGGMSFHGGLLGVIIACFIFGKIKKIMTVDFERPRSDEIKKLQKFKDLELEGETLLKSDEDEKIN